VRRIGLWIWVLIGLTGPALAAPGLPEGLGAIEGRVVWVDFWASWCSPCRRSFPWMNAMHEKYADQGLQIIAVNVDSERAAADAFLAELPAQFAVRFDPDGQLARHFDVKAMPSSYLIDAGSGQILATHFGFKFSNADAYEAAIVAALSGQPVAAKE
jgi:cytochrome c biogenesis protein CcmG/thiol:disulfide interchange protein DsbE